MKSLKFKIPGKRFLAPTALLVSVMASSWLFAQYQQEPPEFGDEYTFPTPTHPEPRANWLRGLDVGILALGLGLGAWIVLKRRSRTGTVILAIAMLAYFGFFRKGCICPIGSIQNVSLGLSDPGYSVSLVIVAVFFLPLLAALFFGRIFCGGVCPHGALQDLILLRPVKVPKVLDRILGWLRYIYLTLAIWFAAWGVNFTLGEWKADWGKRFIICEWDPFVGIFRLDGPFTMIAIGAGLIVLGMFVGRPYCRWLCPYGAILSIISRVAWKSVQITPDKELECGLCNEACPYNAIKNFEAERSSCVSCARCYDHCPRHREARKPASRPLVHVEVP